MPNALGPEYATIDDTEFIPKFKAACFCGAVQYEVNADPVDAKICHCLACQKLHGASMQWAAIFHKSNVRITTGLKHLTFYNSERDRPERILPCKVSWPSRHCLISAMPEMCRIHLNQRAIFSMAKES